MKGRFSQHLGILGEYARAGFARRAEFRLEFVNQVVMDCIFYLVHILTFEFLYNSVDSIQGWSRSDMRVFLGMVFVSDAFHMIWLGAAWFFGAELKDGKLDTLRLRPAHPVIVYFFQRFSPEACLNMVIAVGYLSWAWVQGGYATDPLTAALFLWALGLTWLGRIMLAVLFSMLEFRFVNSDLSRLFLLLSTEAADRPIDVYPRRMAQFLLWLVPVATWSWFPAALLLGRVEPGFAALYTLFVLAFSWWTLRAWRRSFRHYESALS